MENISGNGKFHVMLFDGLGDWHQCFCFNWFFCLVCALAFQAIYTRTQNLGCNGNVARSKWKILNSSFSGHYHQYCITWMSRNMSETPRDISGGRIAFGELLSVA